MNRRGAPAGASSGAIPALGILALVTLLVACRGGLPGVPVADDYDSLRALRFEHPVDPFGPMGSLWYWRPLGRQVYFSLLSPLFFSAPWVLGVLHAALFVVLYAALARTLRRSFDPLAAAAIASFPLLAEPSRALLVWPTGAQPLLAMACIAVALHEAAARRLATALGAMAAALLAHEQAILVVPLVPWVARAGARTWLATGAVAAAWVAARAVAYEHGAGFPPAGSPADALAALPSVLGASLEAQLGLGELEGTARAVVLGLLAACGLAGLGLFVARRASRSRLAAGLPVIAGGVAWFALAIAPLAFSAGLWTPRHSALPGLGLGVALVGLLACASPRLAAAFMTVRLVALLLAPTAPPVVEPTLAARTRPLSFLHVTRMQRTVDSARRTLAAAHPDLPPGTRVGWWALPRHTEIGFVGPTALRTWYGDSTLTWTFWDRFAIEVAPPPVILAFEVGVASPARLMEPAAVAALRRGLAIGEQGDFAGADAALVDALAAQEPSVGAWTVEIVRLRARLAFEQGALARADSLNRTDLALVGPSAPYYGLAARIALRAGRPLEAKELARRALDMRPGDAEAQAALSELGSIPAVELAEF